MNKDLTGQANRLQLANFLLTTNLSWWLMKQKKALTVSTVSRFHKFNFLEWTKFSNNNSVISNLELESQRNWTWDGLIADCVFGIADLNFEIKHPKSEISLGILNSIRRHLAE